MVDQEKAMMGKQKGEKGKKKERNQQWAGDVAGVGIERGERVSSAKK